MCQPVHVRIFRIIIIYIPRGGIVIYSTKEPIPFVRFKVIEFIKIIRQKAHNNPVWIIMSTMH